jgi:hypothetical protein
MSIVHATPSASLRREHSGHASRDLGVSQAKRAAIREFVKERRHSVDCEDPFRSADAHARTPAAARHAPPPP